MGQHPRIGMAPQSWHDSPECQGLRRLLSCSAEKNFYPEDRLLGATWLLDKVRWEEDG